MKNLLIFIFLSSISYAETTQNKPIKKVKNSAIEIKDEVIYNAVEKTISFKAQAVFSTQDDQTELAIGNESKSHETIFSSEINYQVIQYFLLKMGGYSKIMKEQNLKKYNKLLDEGDKQYTTIIKQIRILENKTPSETTKKDLNKLNEVEVKLSNFLNETSKKIRFYSIKKPSIVNIDVVFTNQLNEQVTLPIEEFILDKRTNKSKSRSGWIFNGINSNTTNGQLVTLASNISEDFLFYCNDKEHHTDVHFLPNERNDLLSKGQEVTIKIYLKEE